MKYLEIYSKIVDRSNIDDLEFVRNMDQEDVANIANEVLDDMNVANIDDDVEFVQRVDPVANMNDVAERVRRMDPVDFENIMDDDDIDFEIEEERALSDDSGHNSDLNDEDDPTDVYMKFVPREEILALNDFTKHCKIECYYTNVGALIVCAECMIRPTNVDLGLPLYVIKRHTTDAIDNLIGGRLCDNCRKLIGVILPCNICPECTKREKQFL